MDAKQILSRYGKAHTKKLVWDNKYQRVFEMMMPERDDFYNPTSAADNPSAGENKRSHLFTSTGEQSADAFVNRIQSILTPIGANWIGLEVDSMAENAGEVNRELDAVSAVANVFKDASNFDASISEFYYDLIAGTACMLSLPGTAKNPLVFTPVPISQICIEEGVNGEVSHVYRSYELKQEVMKNQWSELKDMKIEAGQEDKAIPLVECTYKDYDRNITIYKLIDVKAKKVLVTRESKTSPFTILRWSKCPGEVYGRGLGLKALNDLQTLNKITEYGLNALAFTVPTFLAQQDATIDYDDFELAPGTLNIVSSTAANNPSIVPLQMNINQDVSRYNVEVLKMDIKKSLLDNTLPSDGGAPKTATEISERMRELEVNLSSVYGRLISDFLKPIIVRILDILQSFDYIDKELNIDDIDGFGFKIKINTPLAKQQSQGELQNITNAIQILLQVDPSGQMLNAVMKTQDVASYTLDLMGVPNRFVYTAKEIKANQEAQAQAQRASQIQGMEDEVTVSNETEKGKENAKQ